MTGAARVREPSARKRVHEALARPPGPRAAGLALAALLAGALLSSPVIADTVTFDHEACASDPGGMVHVALGREVLRMPMDHLTSIRALPPEKEALAPAPPDPTEPEGCPLHPIRGLGFTFFYAYRALLENKYDPKQPPGTPELLRIVAVAPDYWGLQPVTENDFVRRCAITDRREELDTGFVACRVPPNDPDEPRSEWAVSYQAKPEVYGAPFGRPFIVGCYPAMSNGVQTCTISYKLWPTVNVSYRIWIHKIPIESIVEFDKSLREQIAAARVPGYVWPEQQPKPAKETGE